MQPGQPLLGRGPDHVVPQRAGLGAAGAGAGVDPDAGHARGAQQDHVVERGQLERRRGPGPRGDAQAVLAGEGQRAATSSACSASTTAAGCWSAARFQAMRAVSEAESPGTTASPARR